MEFSQRSFCRSRVKAKRPFYLHAKTKMAMVTVNIGDERLENIIKKYENLGIIPYKLEFADVKVDTLLKVLGKILKKLKTVNYISS